MRLHLFFFEFLEWKRTRKQFTAIFKNWDLLPRFGNAFLLMLSSFTIDAVALVREMWQCPQGEENTHNTGYSTSFYETTWPLRAIAAKRLPKWRTRKKMAMKRRIFGKLSFNDWLCSVSNLAIVVDQTRPTVLIYFAFLVKGVTIPCNLIFVVWLLMITIFLVDTTKFSNSKQLCRNTEVLSFKLDQFGLTLVVLILLLVKAYVDSCLIITYLIFVFHLAHLGHLFWVKCSWKEPTNYLQISKLLSLVSHSS